MGTKRNPGKYDCYEKAKPDEPIFVLLGRDIIAGLTVAVWAGMAEQAGEKPEKIAEAMQCANAMSNYAIGKLGPAGVETIKETMDEFLAVIGTSAAAAAAAANPKKPPPGSTGAKTRPPTQRGKHAQ